jgi:hypothetical protein
VLVSESFCGSLNRFSVCNWGKPTGLGNSAIALGLLVLALFSIARRPIHNDLAKFGESMTTGHVFIATSLDGFIAREDGSIDWLLSRDDPNEDHGYQDFIKDIDGLVMGRGSFEAISRMDKWPYDRPVLVLSKI